MSKLVDNPLVLQMLYYPRAAEPHTSRLPNVHDGSVPVGDDVVIGYRLYRHERSDAPLVVFFHGNGEVAADYDGFAPLYHGIGVALLVVDYRGYGWSTGSPLITTLLPDAEAVCAQIPDILERAEIAPRAWLVKGRSLGSVPAVHLAYRWPERFAGLVIESGMADLPSVYRRLGHGLAKLVGVELPFRNAEKMREVDLPLLVIHGEDDNVLPVDNGQRIYDASPSTRKTLLRVPGAGHNDLLMVAMQRYFQAMSDFVRAVC
jgi:pimeloyl-ACP methyl ester carboxylesterase